MDPRRALFPCALLAAGCAAAPVPPPPDLPSPPPPDLASPPAPASAPAEQPPPGIFHRVLRGQTLYTIARTYGVELSAVAEANDIADPDRIETEALLFIPGAPEVLEVPITVGPGAAAAAVPFLRPLIGPVNSPFGRRRGRMHYGIDIGAAAGSAVRAARDGRVLYAGSGYRGYGKLVILDHGDGYQTLYAHNRKLLARSGRTVRAGEVIARVGATGNATGPHLHFEIRRNDHPLDPAPLLAAD